MPAHKIPQRVRPAKRLPVRVAAVKSKTIPSSGSKKIMIQMSAGLQKELSEYLIRMQEAVLNLTPDEPCGFPVEYYPPLGAMAATMRVFRGGPANLHT